MGHNGGPPLEPLRGAGAVLVTFAEAERLLRLSRMTLHKMIVAGELKVRRIGRHVRLPMSEIRRLGTPGVSATSK